jgi:large conductance mechanosensitive channel
MAGFKKFLLRGNVVDLAVAVVIGTAFGLLVKAFVGDFITPIVAAFAGKANFSTLAFTIHKSRFAYGDFINNVLTFAIVAAVVYFFVVVPLNSLMDRYKPSPDEPTPTADCPHCMSSIPQAASVCAFCTRDVVPTS